jgi:hypothetical protein
MLTISGSSALAVALLCIALASAETLHGIARTVWLVPRIGKERARRLSVFTGTGLAFLVCWWGVPRVGWSETSSLLALGLMLAVFMASFDIALGLWIYRGRWRKVLADFDPRKGNWLCLGLTALIFIPLAVVRLQSQGQA